MTHWRTYWVWLILAFLADQVSKVAVVHLMGLKTLGIIPVWPPFLVFRMGWNRGVNFGLMPADSAWGVLVLVGLSLLICGLVTWWVRQEKRPLAWVSAGLLVGGALGNVFDRLVYGAVADFLNMSCCGIVNRYSFNIADVAVFAGAIGLVLFAGQKNEA